MPIMFIIAFIFQSALVLGYEHAKLYGGIDLSYYYVDIYVGTPPMRQTVIIDTGSLLTAFPCDGCDECG
jgi:hypothetical protein